MLLFTEVWDTRNALPTECLKNEMRKSCDNRNSPLWNLGILSDKLVLCIYKYIVPNLTIWELREINIKVVWKLVIFLRVSLKGSKNYFDLIEEEVFSVVNHNNDNKILISFAKPIFWTTLLSPEKYGATGNRTLDLMHAKHALYQLSHDPLYIGEH